MCPPQDGGRTQKRTTREIRPILGWSLSAPQPCLAKQAAREVTSTLSPTYTWHMLCVPRGRVPHNPEVNLLPEGLVNFRSLNLASTSICRERSDLHTVAQHTWHMLCLTHGQIPHNPEVNFPGRLGHFSAPQPCVTASAEREVTSTLSPNVLGTCCA